MDGVLVYAQLASDIANGKTTRNEEQNSGFTVS
jgi:hypothetical protein